MLPPRFAKSLDIASPTPLAGAPMRPRRSANAEQRASVMQARRHMLILSFRNPGPHAG